MKKQPHLIKKIITAVFCLLLIVTAFIPGIELYYQETINSNIGSNTTSRGIATMISPSQLINAGNASDEEIAQALVAAEKKVAEINAKYAAMEFSYENDMNDEIKNAKEVNEYYALMIRNTENINAVNDDLDTRTSVSGETDFVKSSSTYSLITIIFYVLVACLLVLMILQTFLNIKSLAIITRILSVCVFLVSIISLVSLLSMEVSAEWTVLSLSRSVSSRCTPTLAGPLAILLSIPTMILAICATKKKKI